MLPDKKYEWRNERATAATSFSLPGALYGFILATFLVAPWLVWYLCNGGFSEAGLAAAATAGGALGLTTIVSWFYAVAGSLEAASKSDEQATRQVDKWRREKLKHQPQDVHVFLKELESKAESSQE